MITIINPLADLVCSSLLRLQWGFHFYWISANLKSSWTTHATSTSTPRRASQWAYGGSLVPSCCFHLSVTGLQNPPCVCGTDGSSLNWTTIDSFSFKGPLRNLQYVLKHNLVCSYRLLSLSIFVSHRHTLPASQWDEAAGRSPEWYREALGDGRPVIIYLHGNVGTRWDVSSMHRDTWIDLNGV